MAKYKSVQEFNKKLSKDIETAFNQNFLQTVGKAARDIIYKRTKAGKGVSNGQLQTLKKLTKPYVEYRKGKKLGRFGSPGRSNLTFSGEMLESFEIAVKRQIVTLTINNQTRDDGKTNEEVAQYVTENGRPFFDLSNDERQIIVKLFETEMRKIALKYK